MIKHYAFQGLLDLPSLSPFCIKVDAYLRMRQLPNELISGDPRKAPKGKLPMIIVDGETIADSQLIIADLEQRFGEPEHTPPLDQSLDPADGARAHLLRRTIEEALYFEMLYSRWVDDEGWAAFRPIITPLLPKVVGPVLLPLIRRSVVKSTIGQGTARHSRDEVYQMAQRDLDAIAHVVGTGPYALGDTPRTVDATVYGFLAALLFAPHESPLKQHLQTLPSLVAYCERIRAQYYK